MKKFIIDNIQESTTNAHIFVFLSQDEHIFSEIDLK